jgi:hypothetical protein
LGVGVGTSVVPTVEMEVDSPGTSVVSPTGSFVGSSIGHISSQDIRLIPAIIIDKSMSIPPKTFHPPYYLLQIYGEFSSTHPPFIKKYFLVYCSYKTMTVSGYFRSFKFARVTLGEKKETDVTCGCCIYNGDYCYIAGHD